MLKLLIRKHLNVCGISWLSESVWNLSCLSLFVYILTSALISFLLFILTGIRDNMFRDLDNPAPPGHPGSGQQWAGAGGDQGAWPWGGWGGGARAQGGWWGSPRPAPPQPSQPERHRGQDLATQPRVHPLLLGLRRGQANEVRLLENLVSEFCWSYNSLVYSPNPLLLIGLPVWIMSPLTITSYRPSPRRGRQTGCAAPTRWHAPGSWPSQPLSFQGLDMDSATSGRAPLPWEVDLPPSNMFKVWRFRAHGFLLWTDFMQEEVRVVTVPHTGVVKTCHKCRGNGGMTCGECYGKVRKANYLAKVKCQQVLRIRYSLVDSEMTDWQLRNWDEASVIVRVALECCDKMLRIWSYLHMFGLDTASKH